MKSGSMGAMIFPTYRALLVIAEAEVHRQPRLDHVRRVDLIVDGGGDGGVDHFADVGRIELIEILAGEFEPAREGKGREGKGREPTTVVLIGMVCT